MKTLTRITLFAAGLTVAALPLLTAGDAAAPAAASHPRLRALWLRRHAIRQRMAHRLNLTADQISQFKAERAKTVTAVKAIRADRGLTPEQKKAKVRATVQAARTAMRGVLSPDQQKQLQHLRARLRARIGHGE
jgi:hypothetical protein